LSALDANLRRQMQLELKTLQRELGIAFVFVTHDQEEAMTMSDRIALLRAGELEQVAAPQEIYRRPATAYVAQFIGQTNLMHANVSAGIAECGGLRWPTTEQDGPATYSVRPECIVKVAAGSPSADGTVSFRAQIVDQVFQGATELWQIETASGSRLLVKTSAKRGTVEMEFALSVEDVVRVRD
jgi:ABC-type Fe3+/spermidine/putrescine transport system ATPase subunit